MVKIILVMFLIYLGSVIFAQTGQDEFPCGSELLDKVKRQGLRSLGAFEIIPYYLDLKKCNNREEARRFNKQAEVNQLIQDAENSKYLQGFTSGCVYFTITILLYLTLS